MTIATLASWTLNRKSLDGCFTGLISEVQPTGKNNESFDGARGFWTKQRARSPSKEWRAAIPVPLLVAGSQYDGGTDTDPGRKHLSLT